ncbi:MAG: stage II sporulation protein M [Candidatus Diapherotrites archaeon]|nr:stage II sporulation protein M [Candidatus Diapherotrites archaeon]
MQGLMQKINGFFSSGSALNFFLISFVYSVLLVFVSYFIFTKYAGILSVFLVSLALIPLVSKYLDRAEKFSGRFQTIEKKNISMDEIRLSSNKFSLKQFYLDFKAPIKVFLYCFLGVFAAYAFVSLVLPTEFVQVALADQSAAISGNAFSLTDFFSLDSFLVSVFRNNLFVLFVCFALPLILEHGTTFVIIWNASLWGTVFALHARNLAAVQGSDPGIVLLSLLAVVLPHTLLEAGSYFVAAIAGSVSHHALTEEKVFSSRAKQLLFYALLLLIISFILLVLGAFVETIAKDILAG